MSPLETLQHNATLRQHTETLADYVIRLTDTYMRRESDVEMVRRTRTYMHCVTCDHSVELTNCGELHGLTRRTR